MNNDGEEIRTLFPWWAAADDDDPDAARRRALAWLEGPYARVAATTRFVTLDKVGDLFERVRQSIHEHGVEPWTSPVELESWLRGLLQGCALAVNGD